MNKQALPVHRTEGERNSSQESEAELHVCKILMCAQRLQKKECVPRDCIKNIACWSIFL